MQAEKFAGVLRKLGLKKHDRIGIYSPNNYEWTVRYFIQDIIIKNKLYYHKFIDCIACCIFG